MAQVLIENYNFFLSTYVVVFFYSTLSKSLLQQCWIRKEIMLNYTRQPINWSFDKWRAHVYPLWTGIIWPVYCIFHMDIWFTTTSFFIFGSWSLFSQRIQLLVAAIENAFESINFILGRKKKENVTTNSHKDDTWQ